MRNGEVNVRTAGEQTEIQTQTVPELALKRFLRFPKNLAVGSWDDELASIVVTLGARHSCR